MVEVAHVEIGDGVQMPQLGCGVFRVPPPESERVVGAALEAGYRLIDTAASYGNERGVGRAIHASGIPRNELFVTTKLQNSDQGFESALAAFERSRESLALETIDLYLIHWPVPKQDRYVETWRALESILAGGGARAVGVSNFSDAHLRRVVAESDTVPSVNQVELHPGYAQTALRSVHDELGVVTEAWSPLGRGPAVLDHPEVLRVAQECGRTAAQVVLRWHLDLGHVVIPKSTNPQRLRENTDVFDFTLTDAARATLTRLSGVGRVGPDPEQFDGH
jgi:diketogulonate reductase-like aldo/keto reductase